MKKKTNPNKAMPNISYMFFTLKRKIYLRCLRCITCL